MDFLIYFAKSCAILGLFYGIYSIFLARDTFYKVNRYFLLAGIFVAICAPLLVFTVERSMPVPDFNLTNAIDADWVNAGTSTSQDLTSLISWWHLVIFVYLAGVCVLTVRFINQLIHIFKFLKTGSIESIDGIKYLQRIGVKAPFSFFNYIVYDPQEHNPADLQMILAHERSHVKQWHSLDIITSQLFIIFQWVNPLAWLYAKRIEQNIEFMADAAVAHKIENEKSYQLTLVKTSTQFTTPALAHTFYHSFIKKRIVMLNKQSSRKINTFKTLFILPVLAVFLWSFNVEEKITYTSSLNSDTGEVHLLNFNYTSSSQDIKNIENYFLKNHPDVLLKIDGVSRNAQGEINKFDFLIKFENDADFVKRFSMGKEMLDYTSDFAFNLQYKSGSQLLVQELMGERPQALLINNTTITLLNPHTKGDKRQNDSINKVVMRSAHAHLDSTKKQIAQRDVINRKQKREPMYQGKTYRFVITKTMSKEDLDALIKEVDQEYNVSLQYSDLDYNDKGEIVSIRVQVKDKDSGNTGNYALNSSNGINDIVVFKTEEGTFGLTSVPNGNRIDLEERRLEAEERRTLRRKEMEERTAELKEKIEERKEEMLVRQEEMRQEMETRREEQEKRREEMKIHMQERERALHEHEEKSVRVRKNNKELKDYEENLFNDLPYDVLYVVDGKIVEKEAINKITPDHIESINILKGQKAIDQYGDKAKDKNGVIEINLKE